MQVQYQGRLVDSDTFRVSVYSANGLRRVAEGWDDYQRLLETGKWFDMGSVPANVPAQPKSKKKVVKRGTQRT